MLDTLFPTPSVHGDGQPASLITVERLSRFEGLVSIANVDFKFAHMHGYPSTVSTYRLLLDLEMLYPILDVSA